MLDLARRLLAMMAFAAVAAALPAAATFPGANGKIAFIRDLGNDQDDIFVINANGSGETNLTDHPADDEDHRWSPDGRRLVFVSDRDGNDEIYVMNADGSGVTRLTENLASDVRPAWSPDGTKILFESDRDFNREVYVMSADGSDVPLNLTGQLGDDGKPQWAPDGSAIAFVRDLGGNAEIYAMDPDGSNERNLTNSPGNDDRPNWSPDSSKIAFNSDRDGDDEIYVMTRNGEGLTRLTENTGRDVRPAWSPDGTKVAIESDRDGDGDDDIWVIDAAGGNPVKLTESTSDDGQPEWQPLVAGPGSEEQLACKKLLLKWRPDPTKKRGIDVLCKDPVISLGGGNGSADDPTSRAGSLRVVSTAGDTFDHTYALDTGSWRYLGKGGDNEGYKFRPTGSVKSILVKPGKIIKIVAKGTDLGHALVTNPDPVHVVLALGGHRYCMTFGGQVRFTPSKKYLAKRTPPAEACPPPAPSSG